ncbi:MAG: hypothetical protein CMJ78_24285 [Planctomycetaceae bacterium]|nr:hypothetical protein [Planctomycetaceae bacterium]
MQTARGLFLVLFVFLPSVAQPLRLLAQDDRQLSLAEFLEASCNSPTGIVSLPFSNDADLAITLAKKTKLRVSVTVSDRRVAGQAQLKALGQSLLGKRISIRSNDDNAVAFADNFLDMLIVEDFAVLGSRKVAATEVLRAICPDGVLAIKLPADGVSTVADWLGIDQQQVRVKSHQGAAWGFYRKPEPTGLSQWPYWYGDAGNNPYANDSLIKDSHMVQWLGLPYYTTSEIISVAANGRVFNVLGGNVAFPFSKISPNEVHVRNIYNGTVLWTAKLPENFYALRSAFAATKDTFYLLDGNRCLLYDAATGRLKESIQIGTENEMLQWMALDGDMLVVLAGPKVKYSPRGKTYEGPGEVDQSRSPWVFGHRLYGYDLSKKYTLWKHDEEVPIDALATGLTRGKVVFYAHGSHLRALDTNNGNPLWANRDEKLFGETYKATNLSFAQTRSGFCNLLCNDDYVFLDPATKKMLSAFDAKTGKLLWTEPRGRSRFTCKMLFADDKLLTNNVSAGARVVEFEPRSGKKLGMNVSAAACTRITGCNGEIFTRNSFDSRATCVEGVIPACGMLYMSAYACYCNYQLLGYQALSSGSPKLSEAAEQSGKRLQVFRANLVKATGKAAGETDWTNYRADATHSGSTTVAVGEDIQKSWRSGSGASQLTPPIAVGQDVYVGSHDGVLKCINSVTGQIKWKSFAEGSLIAAPTYWNGSVYVGSGDGHVYRFDASSGECIWRFQVAPRDRLIRVYGNLSSTWPVHSGVLIHNDTLIVAAGITYRNGTAVVALDPTTGELKWQNLDIGERYKVSAQGTLIGFEDQVFLSGGLSASAVSLDLATGKLTRRYSGGARGYEIGILGGKTLVFGGRPIFTPPNLDQASGKSDSVRFMDLAAGSKPVALGRRNSLFPVWDNDILAHSQMAFSGLLARNRRLTGDSSKDVKWGPISGHFAAITLTSDALIGLTTKSVKNAPYQLVAYSKQDGKQIWRHDLEGTPKLDGMAINANGQIIIAFADRSIEAWGK